MAFETIDDDGSGGLGQSELSGIMQNVCNGLGLKAPTDEDLAAILKELDNDYDGVVDKQEFLSLIMMVISKLLESEEELQDKVNKEIHDEMKAKV